MWKWLFSLFGVTLIGLVLIRGSNHNEKPAEITESGLVKAATLTDIQKLLPNHKLTLLNLWASWCEPCKAEFPTLLSMRQKYATQGLQVLFLSVDFKSEMGAVESFLRSQNIDFETYIAAESGEKIAMALDSRWSGGVPASFLFDANGTRLDSWQGEINGSELESKITAHLEK